MATAPHPRVVVEFDRRRLLAGGVSILASLGATGAFAQQPTIQQPGILSDGAPFDRSQMVDYARSISRKPYAAPGAALPDWLGGLNFEQYNGIRNRPERAVWGDQPKGFVIEPLHRGFIFQAPVQISMIEGGNVRRLAYASSNFELGKLVAPPNAGDIGFSGFRLLKTTQGGPLREVAMFQGASFLRAIGRGQVFGDVARALSLKTADPRGEEFPFFRAFWIEEPQQDDLIVIHALLDSESVTGAFTYTVRAGDVTLIDTEAAIFPRVPLDNVGIAGMQGTYFYGPLDRRGVDDFRPAVNEIGGLQMQTGQGEWIWRPVNNPKQLQISAFMDENPKGFGFAIRDREFSSYQDHDAQFERRPTLWIEPIGDWGPGVVQLIEIPSDNEIHDNIIAQWRPKEPLKADGEYFFAYRQHWCWSPPDKPVLATVSGTRAGRTQQARRRRFVVDFTGEKLGQMKPEEVSTAIWASNNGVNNVRVIPGGPQRATRVVFDLDTGNDSLIEMRLTLMAANAPISETWLYRWTQ